MDISYGVLYFKGGPNAPMPCPDCPPPGGGIARQLESPAEKPQVIKPKIKKQKGINKR
jgi:hypothetical protein